MNNLNDKVFDEKLKVMAKREIQDVPEYVENLFTLQGLNLKKKRFRYKFKKVCSITALVCSISILAGMAMPTYANYIPYYGKFIGYLNDRVYENYDSYASDLNITKESNGIKVTVNKVIYDEATLSIIYTVRSDTELSEEPSINEELRINGKPIDINGHVRGDFIDDKKTYVASIEYDLSMFKFIHKEVQEEYDKGYVDIPSKFKLDFRINGIYFGVDELGKQDWVNGKWNFVIPVTSEKIQGKVNEIKCNVNLEELYGNININKVIITPINTLVQIKKKNDIRDMGDIRFWIFDDKGRMIESKGSHRERYGDDFYQVSSYEQIYDDTEKLTFIPYKKNNVRWMTQKEEFKLNLSGETTLYCTNGEVYGVITRIECKDGKTNVYCKSKYNIIDTEIDISDERNNIIFHKDCDNNKSIRYLKDTNEYMMIFDGELKGQDYKISIENYYGMAEVLYDHMFDIEVK